MERVAEIAKQHEPSPAVTGHTRAASPAASSLPPALELQQFVGNQAMQEFLRSGYIHAKLAISNPDDPEEREADHVASTIMRKAAGAPCSCSEGEEMCEECQQKHSASAIQRRGSSPAAPTHIPRIVSDVLRSPGHPLDSATRAFFEPRFGRDFSDVRVHTDSPADESARSIYAHAYTAGSDIVFASGQYSPGTSTGRSLLAHELTHVVQQPQAFARTIQRQIEGNPSSNPVVPQQAPSGLAEPSAKQPGAPVGPSPVMWGLDMSVKPPTTYVSVAAPGYSLDEVATYLYGSPDFAASLSAANGSELPKHLSPGKTLRLAGGDLAQRAATEFGNARMQGTVLRSQGMPVETPESQRMIYRFNGGGQSFELTENQYLGMIQGASFWIKHKAGHLQDTASVYLEAQQDHVKESSSIIRGISDWAGGADLPDESTYQTPIEFAQQIIDSQDRLPITVESKTKIAESLPKLQTLAEMVDRAEKAWHTYINATIEGAGSAVHALEVTRNVSFGIAAGIAGAVAAPAIFAAAGGGIVGGTLAVGGGAVAGAATSGTLSFAGATGGQALSMAVTPGKQEFDWGYVGHETWSGTKSGALQGGLGAAGALAAPGLSNVISNRLFGVGTKALTSTAGRLAVNSLTGAILGAPLGGVGAAIDKLPDLLSGRITFSQYLVSIGSNAAIGSFAGTASSLIPIEGLYRTGGQRLNPFSGTPTTPSWMLAAPFMRPETTGGPPPGSPPEFDNVINLADRRAAVSGGGRPSSGPVSSAGVNEPQFWGPRGEAYKVYPSDFPGAAPTEIPATPPATQPALQPAGAPSYANQPQLDAQIATALAAATATDTKTKEKVACGHATLPWTEIFPVPSDRGERVVAAPLTKCGPHGSSTDLSKFSLPAWACVKSAKENTDGTKPKPVDTWVHAHLLHGKTGEDDLHGPGDKGWNLILTDKSINKQMYDKVEHAAIQGTLRGETYSYSVEPNHMAETGDRRYFAYGMRIVLNRIDPVTRSVIAVLFNDTIVSETKRIPPPNCT